MVKIFSPPTVFIPTRSCLPGVAAQRHALSWALLDGLRVMKLLNEPCFNGLLSGLLRNRAVSYRPLGLGLNPSMAEIILSRTEFGSCFWLAHRLRHVCTPLRDYEPV